MVGHLDNCASHYSDITIECAIQGATGNLLIPMFSGSNLWVVPQDETPIGLRYRKAIHGEGEAEQTGQNDRFPTDMVRESTPMQDGARLGSKEQGLLEAKFSAMTVVQ